MKIVQNNSLIYTGKLFLSWVVLYIFLLIHYIEFVYPYFNYSGFEKNFSLDKFFISLFFMLYLSLLFYKLHLYKPSTHLFNIMIFISIIPMLVLYTAQNLSSIYILYVILSVTIVRIVLSIKLNLKKINFFSYKLFKVIIVILSLISLFWLFALNWKFFNLNILEVYEYRHIISQNTPKILAYLYNILFKGIVPVLFLFYLFYEKHNIRKFIVSLILLSLYILIFGLTSHKSFLFLIPAVIGIYIFFSKDKNISLKLLYILTFFLFIFIFFKSNEMFFIVKSLLIRRVIFTPAHLNFSYYEFFSKNPFVFFSDSKFLPFHYLLSYPYDTDIAHLIGREVFGYQNMAANTSWMGYGYAHAGIIGMVIYALIIGLLFKYLDFLSRYLNPNFIVISFFPFILVLFLSSDLKTTFFTHGLLFYLILLNILATKCKKFKKGINL